LEPGFSGSATRFKFIKFGLWSLLSIYTLFGILWENGNFLSQQKFKSKSKKYKNHSLPGSGSAAWYNETKLKNISSSQKPVLTIGNTWLLTELYKSFTSSSTMAYWEPWLSRRRSISTRLETVLFTLYSLYRWNTSFFIWVGKYQLSCGLPNRFFSFVDWTWFELKFRVLTKKPGFIFQGWVAEEKILNSIFVISDFCKIVLTQPLRFVWSQTVNLKVLSSQHCSQLECAQRPRAHRRSASARMSRCAFV